MQHRQEMITAIRHELGQQKFTREVVLLEFNKIIKAMEANQYIDEKSALYCALLNSGMGIHSHLTFDSIYDQASKELVYRKQYGNVHCYCH